MESYIIYIGKVSLAAGAFYIAFLLLFQNQKQFIFNRIYLPVSMALSFVIPLITFTTVKHIEPTLFDLNSFAYLGDSSENIIQTAFSFEWYYYLFGIYLFGVVTFLFHLLLGHVKAILIVKQSWIKNFFQIKINVTKKDVHPFSFFNKIVLSEKTLNNPNLKIIVSHENIHVKEKHTLDILFAEILFLFQWFNPFAWLIKDAVKNNLEYKTDHQIAENYNPQAYQLAMVGLADKKGVAPFLTALNGSQLKNRIIMMKKKTENKYTILKQLIVLPLLAVLVMGLSNREIRSEIVQSEIRSEIFTFEKLVKGKVTDQNGDPIPGASIIVKGKAIGTVTDRSGSYEINIDEENEILVFVMVGFKKHEIEVGKKTKINVKLLAENKKVIRIGNNSDPSKTPLYIVNDVETNDIEKIDPENIENISVLKDKSATDLYGEKGKNGVILIATKKPVSFNPGISGNPVIIVDGKEFEGDINDIPVKDISSMEVKKNQPYTNIYDGQKPEKDKIIIHTKTKYNANNKDPLIVADGIITDYKSMDNIDPETIQSISVLKEESATSKYGEKGKNGVIEITTKKVQVRSIDRNTIQPLFVVDGEIVESIDNLDPNEIQSISVIKDKSAIDKYGKKGKNGVVHVFTKDYKLSSQLELRKFIASEIIYPKKARFGKEGIAQLFVKIDKSGVVTKILEKSTGNELFLDEIVVVAHKPDPMEVVVSKKFEDLSNVFSEETERVINRFPTINIPEYKGKTIAITIKFILQD
jgi:TonB-dependent SusC/RagA subfamily outer membrane receptor